MFSEGDKLVCVKSGEASLGLIKDKVYTCLTSFINPLGEDTTEILESMPPSEYRGYQSSRFRLALPADLKKIEKEETIEI